MYQAGQELGKITELTELEQAYLRSRTEWDQEKLKLAGEMVKLRRAANQQFKSIIEDEVQLIH